MAPLTSCIYRSSDSSTPPSLCPVPTSASTIRNESHRIQIAISGSGSSSSSGTVAAVVLSQYDCVCSMWIACVVSVLLRRSIIVSGSILFNVNCACAVVSYRFLSCAMIDPSYLSVNIINVNRVCGDWILFCYVDPSYMRHNVKKNRTFPRACWSRLATPSP